jgi:hypothetical protein
VPTNQSVGTDLRVTIDVDELPHASHNVFRSNEADVLREMNAFIGGLPQ